MENPTSKQIQEPFFSKERIEQVRIKQLEIENKEEQMKEVNFRNRLDSEKEQILYDLGIYGRFWPKCSLSNEQTERIGCKFFKDNGLVCGKDIFFRTYCGYDDCGNVFELEKTEPEPKKKFLGLW